MKNEETFREFFFPSLKKTFLIMRNAAFLLILGILQAYAVDSYSQKTKLSLDYVNTELIKVLDNIEVESEFYFLYNEKLLDTERKINIDMNEQSIQTILDNLFAGTDVKYTIIDRKIILAPDYLTKETEDIKSVQQQTITGKVTDSQTGETMPGVNILVVGTSIGIITDATGRYSITVADRNATFRFSFIGYVTQEIALNGRSTVDVKLVSEVTGLDEVVVIGYCTKRLSELSSSVAVVSNETLDKGVVSQNLGTMLQGKVPGLIVSNSSNHPQREANIVIRGVGSIGAGYSPLYVVDGIIGGSADPSDIASVTVLKDAAATGLYGSRAANGVIIITTISGQSGKTKISYSGSAGFSMHRKGNLDLMNSAELYENRKQAGLNYYNDQVAAGVQIGRAHV